jgi:hypothetical protein
MRRLEFLPKIDRLGNCGISMVAIVVHAKNNGFFLAKMQKDFARGSKTAATYEKKKRPDICCLESRDM